MTININHKDALFERANMTPIRGKLTLETLQNIRNEIKQTPRLSNEILEEVHMVTLV